jgi:hypothetical protein
MKTYANVLTSAKMKAEQNVLPQFNGKPLKKAKNKAVKAFKAGFLTGYSAD